MESKYSPWLPIKDHYATLVRPARPGEGDGARLHWPDYAVGVAAPALAGVAVGYFFQLRDMQSYIGGVAIFTALLFALVIYVFQLRMQLLENPNVPRDGNLAEFVDQLFANVNYAVVAGVIATTVSMAAAASADDNGYINHVWSGVVTALGLHLMLVVFMCVKRVRAAYHEIRKLPRPTSV